MEKHYEGSNILLPESGSHSKFLQNCVDFFTIYGGSNIWQDLEYMGRVIVGKRNYIWRRIMKAVTFYFWSLEPIPNLYRFV